MTSPTRLFPRLGSLKAGLVAVAFLLVQPAASSGSVITFDNLSIDHLSSTGPHTEAGFTYQAVSGAGWEIQNLFGNPASSLTTYFNDEGSATGDTVKITKTGGGTFTFTSVDTATFANSDSDQVTITGFLAGNPVGSLLLNTSTSSPNSFTTAGSPFSGPIDELDVVVTSGNHQNARQLDNFVFGDAAAVPEPPSLAVVGLSTLVLFGCLRRRFA